MDTVRAIDQGLQQLFEAGLELALAIQADAMAAETPEARAKLASAFHRVSRGVRQTAALKIKLARDAERLAREAASDAQARHAKRIDRRKAVLAKVIDQVIEHEVDEEERLDACEDLRARLELEALDAEAFLDEPIEQQIQRICHVLDLPVPPLSGEVSPPATEGGSSTDSQPPGRTPLSPSGAAPPAGEHLEFAAHPRESGDAAPPRPSG